jgi:hypothetical protein
MEIQNAKKYIVKSVNVEKLVNVSKSFVLILGHLKMWFDLNRAIHF